MKDSQFRFSRFLLIALFLASGNLSRAQTVYTPYAFTNFAGLPGVRGSAEGAGTNAQFNLPDGIAVDKDGNLIVGDTSNHTIRRITTNGVVTTIAGSPGNKGFVDGVGTAQAARFTTPIGLAADPFGNLFVADTDNQLIRLITSNGVVTTVAGQAGVKGHADATGLSASFSSPNATVIDHSGNIFVADLVNRIIRKIAAGGVVSTFAGGVGVQGTTDGQGIIARFNSPSALAIDASDNLYVTDQGNYTIRKITPGGLVSTIAGIPKSLGSDDGPGTSARFNSPQGITVDGLGNIYVADSANHTIRRIATDYSVTTLAGSATLSGSADGTNGTARFSTPRGIAIFNFTNLYVADSANSTIRKLQLTPTNCIVTTLAGSAGDNGSVDAAGSGARFHFPYGLTVDFNGNLYTADRSNDDIRKITPDGVVTTVAGVSGTPGSVNGSQAAAQFYGPEQVTVDNAGNIYAIEFFNNTVRRISPSGTNWVVTTLAGCPSCAAGTNDGIGSAARFNGPYGITADPFGNLFVADSGNRTIRKLSPVGTNWSVSTFAGAPGKGGYTNAVGTQARLSNPQDLAADTTGNLYLVDGQWIRKIAVDGTVTTVAGCPPPGCVDSQGSADGAGANARFNNPQGLAIDGLGNLYVADTGNALIRKLTASGGNWTVSTLGGTPGVTGNTNGVGSGARFNQPGGIAVDAAGNVYVADAFNDRISRGTPPGTDNSNTPGFDTAPGSLVISNGLFTFHLTGSSSTSVVIEASTNLLNWVPIRTSMPPVTVTTPFSLHDHTFFRAHTQ